ncbi:Alpha-aminoadipate--LysW ligase LysX [Planctomycetes bacterium Pan216]|uniref:Alpha-aminoadipate--LysW ligase LysX n=2 Tax=Kolteria novifilia TaxID=2527975 RepID=A0A518B1P3_9BACT|nr:Alpha-aminoadipate--LysW ligase LysX [Planctomycetes bacterium Pan216]
MHLTILGTRDSWHVTQLCHAADDAGFDLEVRPFRSLTATFHPHGLFTQGSPTNLLETDAVLVRHLPPGSLEQVVFRMDALHRLEGLGIPVINPPRAIEACVDKHLSTVRLLEAQLPIPRTVVCETSRSALEAFEELQGDVVVKPLFGSEGRGVIRVSRRSDAKELFDELEARDAVLHLQEYVRHQGFDVRALVIGERVIASMRRWATGEDFRTNVACGGRGEPYPLSETEERLAIAATRAIGARQGGVDLITDERGRTVVLEVNSNPGFKKLVEVTGVEVARAVIEDVRESIVGGGMNQGSQRPTPPGR